MRIKRGKAGSKKAVPRHRVQSRRSADIQERAIEKQVRREGKIEARSVTVTDEWGHKHVVGGFGDVGGEG